MKNKLAFIVAALLALSIALSAQNGPKPEAKPVEAVALTPADADKLQKSLDAVNLAQARLDAAVAGFLRAKAEVIGDHGLAPSKYDLSPDGKSIVLKTPQK